ncbi:MAG: periplasmic heavy metal sensor [Roseateles sp.]|uniref:Spy/CpxP family protein refolding chaperone n=1 Tax=Roseateles sp. TaxID=1971397 RepID=UPI0039E9D9DF
MKAFQIQNLLRVGTVAAALAVAGVAAHAQPGGHGGPGRGGPSAMMERGFGHDARLDYMLDVANASDAQRSQIAAIFKAARQDLAGQRDAGRKLHEQMAALLAAPTLDAAAIEATRAQMSAQHDAASKRLSQARIDAARVLTAEQRARVADVMKKRQARMDARQNARKDGDRKDARKHADHKG